MFWEGERRKRNADDCHSSFMLFLQSFQLHLFLEKRALSASFLLIITTLLLCYGCKQLCPWKRENGEIKDIKYDSVICQIHKYANTHLHKYTTHNNTQASGKSHEFLCIHICVVSRAKNVDKVCAKYLWKPCVRVLMASA